MSITDTIKKVVGSVVAGFRSHLHDFWHDLLGSEPNSVQRFTLGSRTWPSCGASVRWATMLLIVTLGFLLICASANAQPCTPGARQVALYDQPNFSGACTILDSGHYLDSQAIGLANDTVSSIKVGAGAAVTLCWHNNFGGTCESFYNDDNSLADNEVRDNNVSSVRVFSGDTNCNPGTGEVALFKGGQYGGYCTTLKTGYYFDPLDMNILNDSISSLKVGPGASVALYQHANFRGTGNLFTNSDPDLINNTIGNDTVSSAIVYAGSTDCYADSDQVVVYTNPNYEGLCSVLDFGVYRDPVHIGLPNDNISSIHVGAEAAAYLCDHRDFGGQCEGFPIGDPGLSNNVIGENRVSSLYVGPRTQLGYVGAWVDTVLIDAEHFPKYQVPGPTVVGDYPVHRVPTLIGRRQDIVVVLWDPVRPNVTRPTASDVYNRLVGFEDSAAGYFRENSGGLSSINLVGFYGWLSPPAARQGTFYWDERSDVLPGAWFPDDFDQDGDGLKTGHTSRWVDGLRALDTQFDFSKYDHDGDGTVSKSELGIVMITPQQWGFGTLRMFSGNQFAACAGQPTCAAAKLRLDGVVVDEILEIFLPQAPTTGIILHELGHILGWGDMYFQDRNGDFYYRFAPQSFSIMANNNNSPHLDPVLKLKMGWTVPQMVMKSGTYQITDVETSGKVWVLLDPSHGFDEYFIVENRWGGSSYDQNMPDFGLAIWHVIEDEKVYKCDSTPLGTPAASWTDPMVTKTWERCAIRLIRANPASNPALAGNIADDSAALYDMSSGSVSLIWKNGALSGFVVQPMVNAGPMLTTQITTP